MVKNHLKRLNAPKTWKIERKLTKWIARPRPGSHPLEHTMPLATIFKEMLGYADTTREVKRILRFNEVMVDGRKKLDVRYGMGLMDVLSIPKINEHYRMLLNTHGTLFLQKVPQGESNLKLSRIDGKTSIKGGQLQLNFSGGRSILVKDSPYKVGDSLLLEMPEQKVKGHFPLEENAIIFLTGGRHVGTFGRLMKLKGKIVTFSPLEVEGEKHATSRDYVFVVGKDKPALVMADSQEVDAK